MVLEGDILVIMGSWMGLQATGNRSLIQEHYTYANSLGTSKLKYIEFIIWFAFIDFLT